MYCFFSKQRTQKTYILLQYRAGQTMSKQNREIWMNSAVCSVCFCLFNILFVLYFDRVVGCVIYVCVCVVAWSWSTNARAPVLRLSYPWILYGNSASSEQWCDTGTTVRIPYDVNDQCNAGHKRCHCDDSTWASAGMV